MYIPYPVPAVLCLPSNYCYYHLVYVTRFVKTGLIHAQFQVSLFTIIQQIQQQTNSSCLCHCQIFNSLLLLRPHSQGPVWHPQMLGWSVNGSNLPGQADSRQGITTRLAGETGHRCSYILRRVELKTA